MKPIRTAVFPVAGLGTRFLPATKANPKEMLPIVDKPLIQYAAEEAVAAGMKQLVFITNHSKRAIEDHFDSNYELEHRLEKKDQLHRLDIVKNILPPDVNCIYIRQKQPLGLGHAIMCAEDVIGDQAFAVLLADDLITTSPKNCLQQMIEHYHAQPGNFVAVERVAPTQIDRYGITEINENDANPYPVSRIIEKPKVGSVQSNLAVVGRYLLQPSIFRYLHQTTAGKGGEIQLTDAIAAQLANENVFAYEFDGQRFDCGNKVGYLHALLYYGLNHPETQAELDKLMRDMIND